MKLIFQSTTHDQLDASFVDNIIRTCLSKLKDCIAKYGDVYCAYLSNGFDGNMDVRKDFVLFINYKACSTQYSAVTLLKHQPHEGNLTG